MALQLPKGGQLLKDGYKVECFPISLAFRHYLLAIHALTK